MNLSWTKQRILAGVAAVMAASLLLLCGCADATGANGDSADAMNAADRRAHVEDWPQAALDLLDSPEELDAVVQPFSSASGDAGADGDAEAQDEAEDEAALHSQLLVYGSTASKSFGARLADVEAEIAALEHDGYMVQFVLASPENNFALFYDADYPTVTQSTIKAPYVTSLLSENPQVLDFNGDAIERIIVESDNDAYESLRSRYGSACLAQWCTDVGIPTERTAVYYPMNMSVREMAKLWTRIYAFAEEHSDMEDYLGWLEQSENSPLQTQLGKTYRVLSKIGWQDGCDYGDAAPTYEYIDGNPLNDETATNDAGIVFSPAGAYVIAIFSNVPFQPDLLQPLIQAIDNAHSAFAE